LSVVRPEVWKGPVPPSLFAHERLLAGGALTQALSWRWIFFAKVPIGLATIVLGKALIPKDNGLGLEHGVDWLGSILVTASLMTAVYAIVQASSHDWGSSQVLGFGAVAIVLMGAFLTLESRIEYPIMPLRWPRATHSPPRS